MIPLFKVFMSDKAPAAVEEVLKSGYVTQGPKVEEFEYMLRRFFDTKNVLTVNSATSGLQLAVYLAYTRYLESRGIESSPRTFVISTPMTCSATNTAISAVGQEILWADINPKTGNIDPKSVEKLIQNHPDVCAIMCVDWAGYPCDLVELSAIAEKYNVALIRDAAHSFGSVYRDKRVGYWCDFTVYSFQAIKHLTTGDGGAIICKRDDEHGRAKLLRWFGIDRDAPRDDLRCELDIPEAGFKYHMNDINASIGIVNLPEVEGQLDTYRSNAAYYTKLLSKIPEVELLEYNEDRISAYWMMPIKVSPEHKTPLRHFLARHNITASSVHVRNDQYSMFDEYRPDDTLSGLEEFSARQLNLPCGWWITSYDIDEIVYRIKEYFSATPVTI